MSIPLDRLYNFIDSLCDHDVLIYRFFPHGSKKLEHLAPLHGHNPDWYLNMTTPIMICHDQEPLKYDLYNEGDFQSAWNSLGKIMSDAAIQIKKHMHLRSVTVYPFNAYDLTMLCHSEKNSKQLLIYQDNGFVGVYWWSHGIIAQDWFRFAEHDPLLTVQDIKHDFLIYNRAWSGTREYRLKFAEQLLNQDLLPYCKTSFSKVDNNVVYTDHQYLNPQFKIDRTDIEHHIVPNNTNAESSADYVSLDYQTSAIEVVLETLFDDQRWHLTEKSLRPIACGRPFILAATPGSLRYLRSYGIKTFDGLIDESYDDIQDPVLRIAAIIKEMKRIALLPPSQKKVLWNQLYQISKQNQVLFFSDDWKKTITQELKDNIDNALTIMQSNRTGKFWKQLLIDQPTPVRNGFRSDSDKVRLERWIESSTT